MTEYKNRQLFIPLNLRFFDEGEKTEQPTGRKKNKARSEGQVAKSPEIGIAFLFLSSFFALRLMSGYLINGMMGLFNYQISLIPEVPYTLERVYISRMVAYFFGQILLLVAPMFAVVLAVGLVVNIIQVGWKITTKPLRPKISKMNPMKGIKRIFSFHSFLTLIKSLIKFGIIAMVLFTSVQKQIMYIPMLMDMSMEQAVSFIGDIIINLGLLVGTWYIFVAALDYVYVRYKHNKDLKMTKHEVKEEYKQTEGDPLIKSRIRQKMREVSLRRMMQGVPKADVIITNPTHYAVALQYDAQRHNAPVLIAKGVDFLAKRIKEVGREHGVEIVENPPLARAIYNDVEINQEIPFELWEAVADIIVHIFKLKNRI